MFVVVIYNNFMHSPSAVVGPFSSRGLAQVWRDEKDQYLTKDETMTVRAITSPSLLFQR